MKIMNTEMKAIGIHFMLSCCTFLLNIVHTNRHNLFLLTQMESKKSFHKLNRNWFELKVNKGRYVLIVRTTKSPRMIF